MFVAIFFIYETLIHSILKLSPLETFPSSGHLRFSLD